jgi:hypothetical protein
MPWILIGLGLCFVALFMLLHFRTAKQMEQDIALILAECGTASNQPCLQESPKRRPNCQPYPMTTCLNYLEREEAVEKTAP